MNGDSRFNAIWIVITAPMKTEMIATIPIEFSPKSWISASIRFR